MKGAMPFLEIARISSRQVILPTRIRISALQPRGLHSCSSRAAIAHPITAHGPPPKAPSAAPEFGGRVEQQANKEDELKSQLAAQRMPLKKRFWKNVHVEKKPGTFISQPE